MRTLSRTLIGLSLAGFMLASFAPAAPAEAASIAVGPKVKISVIKGTAQLRQGKKHALKLAASGGTAPYRWNVEGLPDGMRVKEPAPVQCFAAPCPQATGPVLRVSGAPAMPGSYDVRVTVTDAFGASSYLQIPYTVRPHGNLAVSVATDKDAYRMDETMRISVQLENRGGKTETARFTTGCQADYDVLPGFSLRAVQLCMQSLTQVTLRPFEEKTYRFEHAIASHPLPRMALPFQLEVVGRVPGVAEARKTVTVTAAN